MKPMARVLACALVVSALATGVAFAQDVYVGTVTRIDHPSNVVMLDDGRMVQIVPRSGVFIDNRPVAITTVQPGTRVVIRGGQPVAYREGRYVVVTPGAAPIVAAPAPVVTVPGTTTVTTITTPPQVVMSGSGIISGIDPWNKFVTLTDGRIVQVTSKTGIWVDGQPSTFEQLRPGMPVMLSAVNPVVSRDGREAVLNTGFFDPSNGSPKTWDSKYAGYEADTSNAAMQPQGGG